MKTWIYLLLALLSLSGRPQGLLAKENTGQKIAERASQYLGTRYKFGGHGEGGMDCSGLVFRVWTDLGLGTLPAQTQALFKMGREIEPEELQAGDILFFENTYRHGISHVGIYTKNFEFIHASNSREGVTVDKVTNPYYLKRIVGARRLY
jgi:cell wall-associated NlpC family hydrolase